MYETAIAVSIGLTVANFILQAFRKREFGTAMKISFFQAFAIGVFLATIAFRDFLPH